MLPVEVACFAESRPSRLVCRSWGVSREGGAFQIVQSRVCLFLLAFGPALQSGGCIALWW